MRTLVEGNLARLVLALALSVVAFAFAGALMFTSGYMISLAATIPLTVLALHVPSLFVRIFGVGKPLLQYLYRLVSHDWVLRMTSHLRMRLYVALCRRTSALAGREKTGRVLSMLAEDIGHAQDLVLRGLLPVAGAWLVALVVLVAAGALSLPLFLVLLVLLALSTVVLPCAVACVNARRLTRAKELAHVMYERLADDVMGMTDWVLSGRQAQCIRRIRETRAQRQAIERSILRMRRVNALGSQLLFCACVIALVVWAALAFGDVASLGGLAGVMAHATAVNAEPYAPNWIAAFALCFFPLAEAFASIEEGVEEFVSQDAALARIDDFLDCAKPDAGDVELPHNFDIDVHDLAFSYGGQRGRVLFEGFDLHVAHGSTLAIVGPSGIGKTTLAELIHGDLMPMAGSVTIGGVDAWKLRDKMAQVVGIMQQDPCFFDMSLADNLRIAKPDASDDEILDALRAVGLASLADGLPDGLDTRIQERGMRFSGGERRRIALARLLLADTPIVILDEPFANIDGATQDAILDTILEVMAGKTIIAITHHVAGIDRFDARIELWEGLR